MALPPDLVAVSTFSNAEAPGLEAKHPALEARPPLTKTAKDSDPKKLPPTGEAKPGVQGEYF
jgi:hypothetical protein